MAITQTGSVGVYDPTTSPSVSGASATGSMAITVPADATMVVIGVSGYSDTVGRLSANGTFDINGNTSVGVGGASSGVIWQAALHYIVNPATGSVNLDWQWGGGAGAVLAAGDVIVMVSFWKGVDTASPTRSSNGNQAGGASTVATSSLTALSGDKIIAVGGTNDAANGELTFSWTNATELSAATHRLDVDASLATADPTGNQTVSYSATGADDAAIAAFVFKAASDGAITWLPVTRIVRGRRISVTASGMTPPEN